MRNLDSHFTWTEKGEVRHLTLKEKKVVSARLDKAEILQKAIEILWSTKREDFRDLAYHLRVAADEITRK